MSGIYIGPCPGVRVNNQSTSDLDSTLINGLGSALLYWWEPRASQITLAAGNITAVTALVGAATITLSTGPLPWIPNGGPNGLPYIAIPNAVATNRVAVGDGISIPAANRSGFYSVGRFTDRSVARVSFATRIAAGLGGGINFNMQCGVTGDLSTGCRFTTAGVLSGVSTGNGNWNAFAVANPPGVGGAFVRINGLPPDVSDNITGVTETLDTHETAHIGNGGAGTNSGGDWAFSLIIDMSANADLRNQIVTNYILAKFGLAA